MIAIKINTGLTTEGDPTNTSTTETNRKHKSSSRYMDQNMLEMLQMVRGFINFMKTNPTTRDQFKVNKLTTHKEYNNEINESEINSCSLDQVQQLINEDKDIVFNALVAADYIDEIECTDGTSHQQA